MVRFFPLRKRAWVPTAGTDDDRKPTNSVAPVVSGTGTIGEVLSCAPGTWARAVYNRFTYQWQRAGVDISGATASTYTLVGADSGVNVRCVVTAYNVSGFASANSNNKAVS